MKRKFRDIDDDEASKQHLDTLSKKKYPDSNNIESITVGISSINPKESEIRMLIEMLQSDTEASMPDNLNRNRMILACLLRIINNYHASLHTFICDISSIVMSACLKLYVSVSYLLPATPLCISTREICVSVYTRLTTPTYDSVIQ